VCVDITAAKRSQGSSTYGKEPLCSSTDVLKITLLAIDLTPALIYEEPEVISGPSIKLPRLELVGTKYGNIAAGGNQAHHMSEIDPLATKELLDSTKHKRAYAPWR
jgi:hypothetical protein